MTIEQKLNQLVQINYRDLTCTKIEAINVIQGAAVKLNPPKDSNTFYALVQVTTDGGATSSSACIRISENTTATTSLGHILGLYDTWDIIGNNNINKFSAISIDNVTNVLTVSYYTYK